MRCLHGNVNPYTIILILFILMIEPALCKFTNLAFDSYSLLANRIEYQTLLKDMRAYKTSFLYVLSCLELNITKEIM